MSVPTKYGPKVIEAITKQLSDGKTLVEICKQRGMPSRSQVQRWILANDELGAQLLEARELGYLYRAEKAVAAAKAAKDPVAGRLAFDAERWILSKLSQSLADKPTQIGVAVNVGSGTDAFAAVTSALDRAAATISGSRSSTSAVAIESEARPADPAG